MATVNYAALAGDILVKVGGTENIESVTHCITRLRLFVKDTTKVDATAIEQLDGVITTISTGGQFQVVIGENVTTVYDAFVTLLPDHAIVGEVQAQAQGQKPSLLNRFIELVSAIFLPVVWTLAGAGLFKAFVALAVTLKLLDPESQTFIILDAAADSVAVKNFTKPLVSLFVMVPLVLIVIGPISTYASQGLTTGITALFNLAPWAGGALMGGLWQILVIFGLHWGLAPIFINDLTTVGYSLLAGPTIAAVLAQGAATLAVFLRSHNAKRRQVAGPAAFSGIMAGVTEPAIYGVNLPLKRPLYFGVVGGAIGGAVIGAGGGAANTFVVPSALALPAYLYVGDFALTVIGCLLGMIVAFLLTFFWVDREAADGVATSTAQTTASVPPEQAASAAQGTVVEVIAPVPGEAVMLESVPDKVFASGALGQGVGIMPDQGVVRAPISGTVISVAASGHAFGLKSDAGVELLVHVGIDTVELKGQHFVVAARKGQTIQAGEELVTVDLAALKVAGYDTTTMVTVTNTSAVQKVTPVAPGPVAAQSSVIVVVV
ncbi:MAG: glucose PTS transporter subunit IIA [Kocuria sp.]|nr:glucose PTS transporter subunit IIA [Kocuria sp.]